MDVAPIKTKRDYRRTLKEIEGLMDAKRGTPEGDRLDVLVTLVEAWEAKHYPIDLPDPVEAIKYHMEQQGLQPRPRSLHRWPEPRLRGAQPQAPSDPQDGLATARRARHPRRVADQGAGGAGSLIGVPALSRTDGPPNNLRSLRLAGWGRGPEPILRERNLL